MDETYSKNWLRYLAVTVSLTGNIGAEKVVSKYFWPGDQKWRRPLAIAVSLTGNINAEYFLRLKKLNATNNKIKINF